MTREEKQKAIYVLKKSAPVMPLTQEEFNDYVQVINQVIDWLEQEPCEDAVSRQAVDRLVWRYLKKGTDENIAFYEHFLDLPLVTPQPRKGHWIDDKCSVCGKGTEDLISSREWYKNEEPNFCPFCGAKMVEPQESEK